MCAAMVGMVGTVGMVEMLKMLGWVGLVEWVEWWDGGMEAYALGHGLDEVALAGGRAQAAGGHGLGPGTRARRWWGRG